MRLLLQVDHYSKSSMFLSTGYTECLPQFILIIEKDTIFRKLLSEKFYEKFKPCLLVTAKGYPDLITRQFLAQINYIHPNIPMIGLFDADPHGINVFCTYKYGTTVSMKLLFLKC
ncbi:unnamed protein product [Schistosoma margrebowiei]|uniref:Uncharacterized protein n=1 Tax=Schistosoma margrebowiei TaxID=48269 RepID=A0A183LWM6_9TREM|nr:unnamed protein product [Schistosoma margrebowiei]